jgi:hypothetical protein
MISSRSSHAGYFANRGDSETTVSEGLTGTVPILFCIDGRFHSAPDGDSKQATQFRSPVIGTRVVQIPCDCTFPEGRGESLPASSTVYVVLTVRTF